MALPKCEWRFTTPTAGWTFVLIDADHGGTGSIRTISAGDRYLTTTNGATPSLTAAMKTALDDGTGAVTYTVTLDDDTDAATGKTTIAASSGTFSITWSSTDLRDILGHTTNITGVTTVTGTNHCLYLWLPNVGRSDPMQPEPSSMSLQMGAIETDGTFVKSPDGYSVGLKYNDLYVDSFKFEMVTGHKMNRATELITNESLKTQYIYGISTYKPFRYHPDRSSDSLYFTQKIEDATEFKPTKVQKGWVGTYSLWSIEYRMGTSTGD